MTQASASSALPLVSVVIPAYNACTTLGETLRSLQNQSWPNIEIIVVDDGSRDDTWKVLESSDVAVRAVRQSNAGLAGARNTGLAAARGQYVALLDADDLCEPERLALQVACLEAHPDMVLCCSDFSAFDTRGEIARSYCSTYYDAISRAPYGIGGLLPQRSWIDGASAGLHDPVRVMRGHAYEALMHGNFVHPPTIMFRRRTLEKIGNFDPRIGSMCDWDWIVRAARTGEIGFIDRPLLRYRLSETQMSSSKHRARAQYDILRVAERLVQRDPVLFTRQRGRFEHELGMMCLSAADALADEYPVRASRLVMKAALRYGVAGDASMRISIKCMLPQQLLRRIRQRRGVHRAVLPEPASSVVR